MKQRPSIATDGAKGSLFMEREKFLEYYMEIQRPLRAYLLSATDNLHEMDDLSQIVWQVLWTKLDQFDANRPFKAWAFGIARLEVLKWRQRKARSREVLSGETLDKLADTSREMSDHFSSQHAFLLDCISELAALSRKVLDLKYGEGRRSREIGKLINRSAEAVDMMLSRTRKVLRECVQRKVMEAK